MKRLLAIALALVFGVGGSSASAEARGLTPVAEVSPGVYLASPSGEGSPRLSPAATRRIESAVAAQPSKRIVGGSETTIEQWPWQTAITLDPALFAGTGFDRQFCGGSLLTPTIVVSAAHCFYDNPVPAVGFNDPELFAAITGRTQLSSDAGQEIPFADYYAFVDEDGNRLYDPDTGEWDVVIAELAGESVSAPIKIAGSTETGLWAPGQPAFVTGWGTTSEDGDSSDVLRQVQIDMLDDPTCDAFYGNYTAETMVCAGVLAGGRDTCQGDSGGPLVVPMPAGGYRLVGDTSFGDGCAQPGVPGVYGRLADEPIRTTLRFGVMELTGLDVVGTTPPPPPPPPPPNLACEKAELKLGKAAKKLKKARRALERKSDKERARRKVKRVRRKVKQAAGEVAAACG